MGLLVFAKGMGCSEGPKTGPLPVTEIPIGCCGFVSARSSSIGSRRNCITHCTCTGQELCITSHGKMCGPVAAAILLTSGIMTAVMNARIKPKQCTSDYGFL